MTKRNILIASVAIVAAGLISLLALALARSGGQPGGLVVNNKLGEISIKEKTAPDFTLETLDGKQVSLSALKGKVVMIDFWSSWCPPCRAEAPELVKAYKEYQGQGVEFIGIAIWDDKGQVQKFANQFGIQYIVGLDEKGKIAIDYAVRGIPEKYFIDRNGTLVKKFSGPMKVSDMDAVLSKMLPQ